MRTRALLAATSVVAVGVLTGCERTTPGSVAMTTEAGSPSYDSSTRTPRSGAVLGVTCMEYLRLNTADQTALIAEILQNEGSVFSPGDAEVAKALADAVCTFLPRSSVAEILLGETPP